MSKIRPRQKSELAGFGEDRLCLYCEAPLSSRYYFCLQCATPYKEESSVLTPIRPMRPSTGTLVKRHAPTVWTLLWTYISVIIGGSVLLELAAGDRVGVHMIVMDALLFVTTTYFAIYYWPSLKPQFLRIGFDRPAAWTGLILLGPLLVLSYAYHYLFLVEVLGAETDSLIGQLRADGFSRGALIFFLCIFPAVGEEIAFRGLLQHWLQVALTPAKAIVLASVLFSAVHFNPVSAPYLFLAGCLMGWTKWRTGSLYPGMLIHFLHNLAVIELFPG